MTVTINYTALLLTIATGVGVATLVYLIIVLVRINRVMTRFDQVIDETQGVLGSLKILADESTTTMVTARQLLTEGQHVVADVAAVSGHVRGLAAGGAGQTLSLIGRIKSLLAIVAGVKTAVATVRHFMERRRHHADDDTVDN